LLAGRHSAETDVAFRRRSVLVEWTWSTKPSVSSRAVYNWYRFAGGVGRMLYGTGKVIGGVSCPVRIAGDSLRA